MKLYANAQIPSGVFYPVSCNKYFSNKTPCTRLEMYVAPCHKAQLLVESKPHKCRQIKRYFMYFFHIFGISWWKLQTDISKECALKSQVSLSSNVTSSSRTSLVIPFKMAPRPGPSPPSPHCLIFFSTLITILCSFLILSCSFICLYVCLTSLTGMLLPWRKRIYQSYSLWYPMSRTLLPTE